MSRELGTDSADKMLQMSRHAILHSDKWAEIEILPWSKERGTDRAVRVLSSVWSGRLQALTWSTKFWKISEGGCCPFHDLFQEHSQLHSSADHIWTGISSLL